MTAIAGIVSLSTLSLLVGVAPQAGADARTATPSALACHGSLLGVTLNKPIVGIAATPDQGGYWLLGADGGVFSYGDAHFYGSTGNPGPQQASCRHGPDPDGKEYWLVASDGGVFSYGDAHFYGSTGNLVLNKPVVGMAPAPDGKGYWLVASDGGIFAFGDAGFYG